MVLKGFLVAAVIFLVFSLLPYEVESQAEGPKATDKVFFDIEIGGVPAGTIELGFFGKSVPNLT